LATLPKKKRRATGWPPFADGCPSRQPRARYFFGAFGSLGDALLVSLGFIVLSVPGVFDVSVVEPVWDWSTGPVEGAAGRV